MKRTRISLAVFLVVVIFSSGVGVQTQASTEDAYQSAINAIEEWIQTIPDTKYQKVEEDQKFEWKVEMEENSEGYARFTYYEEMLEKIGEAEFIYEGYILNKKSIRYFEFEYYDDYYSETSNEEVIEPAVFFERQYEFYKENMTSKREQWVWLDGFFKFFNASFYGTEEDEFINSLTKNNYPQITEVLNQYLTLSKYMLENNPDVIMQGEYLYKDGDVIRAGVEDYERVLGRLLSFVESFQRKLKENEKEAILNYVLPEFKESDEAVKIYKELK